MDTLPRDIGTWTKEDCGVFITDLGYPQYRETFETNLNGYRIKSLDIRGLSSMNIRDFEHQRLIMDALRKCKAADDSESKSA